MKTFGRFSSHHRFEDRRIFPAGSLNQAIVGPTLSTWFTSKYKKSGEKLDKGKGCVRFKSLEDLALDTRGSASGSGTRQKTRMSHAKREVGADCALLLVQRKSRDNRPVGRTVARVSAEEHMANYRAARALMGKGKSSAKKGPKKSAKPKK